MKSITKANNNNKKDTKWKLGSHKGIKTVRNINMWRNIVKFPI